MRIDNALVSIIIPVYKGNLRELEVSLKSAIKQTYRPIEIILVDDGNIPPTHFDYPWWDESLVKIIRNKKNIGLSLSRNAGIEASKGEYIALLDQDDLWEPDKLEKQMERFRQKPYVDLVFSDAWVFHGEKALFLFSDRFKPYYRFDVFDQLLRQNFIPACSVVFTRELYDDLGGFDPAYIYATDHEFWIRASLKYRFDYVNEPLYSYRLREIHPNRFNLNFRKDRLALLKRYGGEEYKREKLFLKILIFLLQLK